MSNEKPSQQAHFSLLRSLAPLAPYGVVAIVSVLVFEFLMIWFGEGAKWSNHFGEIAKYVCHSSANSSLELQNDDALLSTIMTMLSTHHQSLANLLAIAGVIVTVITIIFYLEGQHYKQELETHFQKFKKLEESLDGLNNQTQEIAEDARGMNECQQLIESILLHSWNINDHNSSQEPSKQIDFLNKRLSESVEIRCILSSEVEEQYNGLGRLRDIIKFVKAAKKEGEEHQLFSEIKQLLERMGKIKKLFDDNIGIANDIRSLIGKDLP